ncbi:glycoside hydrolase family 16 protein [Schizophyllum fasciatum]
MYAVLATLTALLLACRTLALPSPHAPLVGSLPSLRLPRADSGCRPSHTDFTSSLSDLYTVVEGEHAITHRGLEMFLDKPHGEVKMDKKTATNDVVGTGTTVNSTYGLTHGKVTFEVSAPAVSGVVTAVILVGLNKPAEMDVELLGGDPAHWQTNVFAPTAEDPRPLFGSFSSVEAVPGPEGLLAFHKYSIDWDAQRIVWAVDGREVRTLPRAKARKDGYEHYPQGEVRAQLGIWDASSPAGTSEWARGPIEWDRTSSRISAFVRSVTVEC